MLKKTTVARERMTNMPLAIDRLDPFKRRCVAVWEVGDIPLKTLIPRIDVQMN
jgi:hypothetical protein